MVVCACPGGVPGRADGFRLYSTSWLFYVYLGYLIVPSGWRLALIHGGLLYTMCKVKTNNRIRTILFCLIPILFLFLCLSCHIPPRRRRGFPLARPRACGWKWAHATAGTRARRHQTKAGERPCLATARPRMKPCRGTRGGSPLPHAGARAGAQASFRRRGPAQDPATASVPSHARRGWSPCSPFHRSMNHVGHRTLEGDGRLESIKYLHFFSPFGKPDLSESKDIPSSRDILRTFLPGLLTVL